MRNSITLICALLLLLLGGLAWAQEAADSDAVAGADETDSVATEDAAEDAAEAEADDAEDDRVIDLDDPDFADLDSQTYDEDEDDFVPTEEVPADEAIPFPSDI